MNGFTKKSNHRSCRVAGIWMLQHRGMLWWLPGPTQGLDFQRPITTKSRDSEKCLKILNRFWTDSEHCWKFWTDSEQILKILKIAENSEQILNITENSEKILNRFWTLLKILNRFWTLLKIRNRFWTLPFFLNQYILLHFH
jgi:hypothetical protein